MRYNRYCIKGRFGWFSPQGLKARWTRDPYRMRRMSLRQANLWLKGIPSRHQAYVERLGDAQYDRVWKAQRVEA